MYYRAITINLHRLQSTTVNKICSWALAICVHHCFNTSVYVLDFSVWHAPKSSSQQSRLEGSGQGCHMVYFKTENTNLGIFLGALEWKMLAYFTAVRYKLWPFGILYGRLVTLFCFGIFGPRKIWQPWFRGLVWPLTITLTEPIVRGLISGLIIPRDLPISIVEGPEGHS
jgi:hypothetical protein